MQRVCAEHRVDIGIFDPYTGTVYTVRDFALEIASKKVSQVILAWVVRPRYQTIGICSLSTKCFV